MRKENRTSRSQIQNRLHMSMQARVDFVPERSTTEIDEELTRIMTATRMDEGTRRVPAPVAARCSWRKWLRERVDRASWAALGAILVVVGVLLGSALTSAGSPSTVQVGTGPAPTPATVCGSLGKVGGGPGACMVKQSQGTTSTAWVVRASGFAPRAPVTVTLTYNSPPQVVPAQTFTRTARVKPVTGPDGTVSLHIAQLFPGALRLGLFNVQVTGSGGHEATTTFIVIPPAP
jgi:hypothetical protein